MALFCITYVVICPHIFLHSSVSPSHTVILGILLIRKVDNHPLIVLHTAHTRYPHCQTTKLSPVETLRTQTVYEEMFKLKTGKCTKRGENESHAHD